MSTTQGNIIKNFAPLHKLKRPSIKLISSGFKSHDVARVPFSSCSRDRALMKSCHGVACVAGGVSEWFLVVDPPFYYHALQAHSRALVCMVYFRPAMREVVSCRNLTRLLTNSLAISPLVFTLGFATKTKSRQLRRLAIGSYTTMLAAVVSSKCRLDECLRVSPRNPC